MRFLASLFCLFYCHYAQCSLTPMTNFGDISPTNTINDIVSAGGVSGNAVDIVTKTNITTFSDIATNSIVGSISALSNTVYNSNNYMDVKEDILSIVKNGSTIWSSASSSSGKDVSNIAFKAAFSMKPKKIANYLWEIGTEGENWDMATNRLSKVYPSWKPGACSGVQAGSFHGRNLDWYYDSNCTIIVRSPAREGKYAVIGLTDGVKGLTDDFMMSEKWSDAYYSVPFTIGDGMNEKGVVIQQNVVPKDTTKSSVWRSNRNGSVICFAIVRYVLDRCSTASEAADMINARVFVPTDFNYDIHYQVSDKNESFIVEDGVKYTSDTVPTDIMTNFRIGGKDKTGIATNPNGTLVWTSVEDYGQGLERYDWVRTNGVDNSTIDGMVSTMKGLWYTKSYEKSTKPFWYTEYCDSAIPELTVMNALNNQSVFASSVENEYVEYTNEHNKASASYRGGKTWQTVHMSIYDQNNIVLYLWIQEDEESRMIFPLKKYRGDEYNNLATKNYVNTKLNNMVYDFEYGTNFTLKLYSMMTNIIQQFGGIITNVPTFNQN